MCIHEQCEVEVLALRPDLLRVRFEGHQVVLEDQLRVVEQPPDQRTLAVVHASTGDKAQHRLALVQLEVGIDVGGEQISGSVRHQKYTSCFLFSIDELES